VHKFKSKPTDADTGLILILEWVYGKVLRWWHARSNI